VSDSILHYVWLMPATMALSFVLILFFGKRLPKKGSEIGIAAVGLCFLFAIFCAAAWFHHADEARHAAAPPAATTQVEGATGGGEEAGTGGEHERPVEPVTTERTWFEAGGEKFEVGTLVDG